MEKAPIFVLDASVAVKWYTHEAGRGKAVKLREHYADGKVDLLAPGLIAYEVGNALRFHPNASKTIGSSAVKALYKMQFIIESLHDDLIEKAMEISYAEGVTFYDAVYLAPAEEEDAKLITADERLVRKLKKYENRVLSLSAYEA